MNEDFNGLHEGLTGIHARSMQNSHTFPIKFSVFRNDVIVSQFLKCI
jgi:hypothetical protein